MNVNMKESDECEEEGEWKGEYEEEGG